MKIKSIKNSFNIFILLIITLSIFSNKNNLLAKSLEGIPFPETLDFNKKSLKLNGLGVRIKKILFIPAHVYVAGLYLEKKSADFQTILSSEATKIIELVFMRHVTPEQITTAWKEGFQNNCGTQCESLQPWIEELCKNTLPVESGEKMTFRFLNNGLEFERPHQPLKRIEDLAFSKIVLASFIGEKPSDSGLKEGLLGSI